MSEERREYRLEAEPRDDAYDQLVDWTASEADRVLLVLRPGLDLEKPGRRILADLSSSQIAEAEASEWPGTRLLDVDHARLMIFALSEEVCAILKRAARGLYEWVQPGLPEDPCFLAGDEPLLTTVAHEEQAYLTLSALQRARLPYQAPRLAVLVEDDAST